MNDNELYEIIIKQKERLYDNYEYLDTVFEWQNPFEFVNDMIKCNLLMNNMEMTILNIILRLGIWGEKFSDDSGTNWRFNMPSTRNCIAEVKKCFDRYGIEV